MLMEWSKRGFSLEEIRELDMVDYLAALGFQPEAIKKNGMDYWYLSPLRTEREASFKVNRKMNRWYDHGLGRGGNLIDFGLLFFKCSFREFMEKCPADFSVQLNPGLPFTGRAEPDEKEHKIIITGERTLCSDPLIRYLHERHIPTSIADQFCREVSYELGDRSYYGIGFKNNAGGYEIRNAFFKCSSSPKAITTIGSGSDEVHIFEGFFDFLSFKTMYRNDAVGKSDCLVLNGAAMFERARETMRSYERKRLWLDRDATGAGYTKYALSLNEGYLDESGLYSRHTDLNDWLCNKSPAQKKHLKLKVGRS